MLVCVGLFSVSETGNLYTVSDASVCRVILTLSETGNLYTVSDASV